ncbi:MAG TPA: YfiR family protein [Opitutaceae bacterium]
MNPCSSSSSLRRPGWRRLVLGLALVFLAPWHAAAQTEEAVKAGFLYNFAKLATWPDSAFASGAAPLVVGFSGGSTLADTFERATRGKNVNGRDFVVTQLNGAAGVERCQMIYIAEDGQLDAVLGAARGKPILIVGDPEALLDRGGMLRFAKSGAKILFDLHAGAVASAGLSLDPKLPKMARTVKN